MEELFWHHYNDLGHDYLGLSWNFEKDGEILWSKRINYAALMSLNPDEVVPGYTSLTKREVLTIARHRTIAPCELVIDLDDCNLMQETLIEEHTLRLNGPNLLCDKTFFTVCDSIPLFKSLHEKLIWCLKRKSSDPELMDCSMKVYQANKGYHLHFIVPCLASMGARERRDWRMRKLVEYGGDLLKSSDKHLIAIEGRPHWKSGKMKERII